MNKSEYTANNLYALITKNIRFIYRLMQAPFFLNDIQVTQATLSYDTSKIWTYQVR